MVANENYFFGHNDNCNEIMDLMIHGREQDFLEREVLLYNN